MFGTTSCFRFRVGRVSAYADRWQVYDSAVRGWPPCGPFLPVEQTRENAERLAARLNGELASRLRAGGAASR